MIKNKERKLTVLDLFCGAGGFSEGFHQAGFDIVFGIDNWDSACETHEINGLGETNNIDLLDISLEGVVDIKKYLEKKYGSIDVIIGSPPCTEFSYAKNGGKGDIEKGMILIRRMLLFIAIFQPKYWIMENAPRLESALDKECQKSRDERWTIKYKKIGISNNKIGELKLSDNKLKIPVGAILTSSDFGTCQNRKRFIAGDFPIELLNKLKVGPKVDVSLGKLMRKLKKGVNEKKSNDFIIDPNYPHHKIKIKNIRDYNYDTSLHPMYWEDIRHLKRRHIQYGKMNLPEDSDLPARTIIALYSSSSRESLIFDTDKTVVYHGKKRKVFRQPSVREVACVQGFPLDFQLKSKKIHQRYKLVGNAVPCQLAYSLAKAIVLDTKRRKGELRDDDFFKRYKNTIAIQEKNNFKPLITKPLTIVDEADDIGKINGHFKAKDTKQIRRKILSSKLLADSSVAIFDNKDQKYNKENGGILWKCCIQKGIGKKYHQIFLDKTSVDIIIKSINNSQYLNRKKRLLYSLFKEIDKGIPIVKETWNEFPGWSGCIDEYRSLVTNKYLKIPDLELFQKMFTSEIEDIEDYVSPIDFFDGIDAIMLKIFSKKNFRSLIDTMVFFDELFDSDIYPHRHDPRIINKLNNDSIPLVTIMSGLVSTRILFSMCNETNNTNKIQYFKSLKKSNELLLNWCNYK